MGQQMRIQILILGFKWLKVFSPKIAIERECTSRWNYESEAVTTALMLQTRSILAATLANLKISIIII